MAGKLKRTVHEKDRQIGINARVAVKKNRVTGKAIRDAVKADPGLEFVDTVSGQTMTVAEAKQAGAITLNVRYNNDRDMEPIPVK